MHGRLCEKCGEHVAIVHITRIVGGAVSAEYHFCEDCAREGMAQAFGRDISGIPKEAHVRVHWGANDTIEITRDPPPAATLCEQCKQRLADTRTTEIGVDGTISVHNLCSDCAGPGLRAHLTKVHIPEAREPGPEVAAKVREAIAASAEVKRRFADEAAADIARAVQMVADRLDRGGKVLLCGNGGSAAEAQHIAAELVGRFKLERPALPAIALTTNSSILTAIANDYTFDDVFARQVGGLGSAGDVLFAYSTSGNSKNVLRAIQAAKIVGMKTIGFTGASGGAMANACDVCIKAPSEDTPTVQECHTAAGHAICRLVEEILCGGHGAPE